MPNRLQHPLLIWSTCDLVAYTQEDMQKPEFMGWPNQYKCSNCNQLSDASRELRFKKLSRYLCMVLGRLKFDPKVSLTLCYKPQTCKTLLTRSSFILDSVSGRDRGLKVQQRRAERLNSNVIKYLMNPFWRLSGPCTQETIYY